MDNLKEFVESKIENLPNKRRFIGGDKDYEHSIDIEKIVTALKDVDVYRMTQEEIDDHIESYPDYYEDLQDGDIVYSDGEVPFKIDALDTWIWEIEGYWKQGIKDATNSDIRDYIVYLYAQELATKLKQDLKPQEPSNGQEATN